MVSKVSEITVQEVANYIRLGELDFTDKQQLETLLIVAKDYITNYTALDDLDEYADLVIVVFILCQDMWDNRTMYIDKGNMNRVVQTILDMHTRNNL